MKQPTPSTSQTTPPMRSRKIKSFETGKRLLIAATLLMAASCTMTAKIDSLTLPPQEEPARLFHSAPTEGYNIMGYVRYRSPDSGAPPSMSKVAKLAASLGAEVGEVRVDEEYGTFTGHTPYGWVKNMRYLVHYSMTVTLYARHPALTAYRSLGWQPYQEHLDEVIQDLEQDRFDPDDLAEIDEEGTYSTEEVWEVKLRSLWIRAGQSEVSAESVARLESLLKGTTPRANPEAYSRRVAAR
jgi:hypothetical protein